MSYEDKLTVHPTAILNNPLRALLGCKQSIKAPVTPTVMPKVGFVGAYATVGCDAKIGERVIIEDYCQVGVGAKIGDDSLLIYRSIVGGYATIGSSCVIGGFIPENTTIGNHSRILGTLTHLHEDPSINWDFHKMPEAAPTIGEKVFIGLNATIIGGVSIGDNAYVCAGATVSNDIPAQHIVSRSGRVFHYSEWKGKLRDSAFFRL